MPVPPTGVLIFHRYPCFSHCAVSTPYGVPPADPFRYCELIDFADDLPNSHPAFQDLLLTDSAEFTGLMDWDPLGSVAAFVADRQASLFGEICFRDIPEEPTHTLVLVPEARLPRFTPDHLADSLELLDEEYRRAVFIEVSRARERAVRTSLAFAIPATACTDNATANATHCFQLLMLREMLCWSADRDRNAPLAEAGLRVLREPCRTTPTIAFHADPEEAAEAYLMGRLPADQVSVYEEHLERCRSCTAIVQETKVFIEGIRAAGRRLPD